MWARQMMGKTPFSLHAILLCVVGSVIGRVQGEAASARPAPGSHVVSTADPLDSLRAGIDHVRAGRHDEAIETLNPLFRNDRLPLITPDEGGVTYWLGRAHLEAGRRRAAHTIWRTGIGEWELQDTVPDIRLADAYIRAVARQKYMGGWARAEALYLRLMEQADATTWETLSEGERERLTQHLRETALVLPESVQRRTGITVDSLELSVSVTPQAAAGELIAGWWRSQDPLPATEQNERLQEHLRRVSNAHDHFGARGRLDDRGKVYIQLGAPRERTQARLGPWEEAAPDQANVRVRSNEFWVYPEVDQKAYFLFVDDGTSHYELGGVDTLFPPEVRTGLDRSFENTISYLEALKRVLGQLAAYHEDYGLRAAEAVDAAVAAQNQADFGVESSENPSVTQAPRVRARELRRENRREDRANAGDRAARVPNSYSTVGETTKDLPVQARVARFLTDEGDTRVAVDWTVSSPSRPTTASPNASPSRQEGTNALVVFNGVQEGPRHGVHERGRQRHFLPSLRTDSIYSHTYETTTQDRLFHLSLQWDQYRTRSKNGETVGSALRRYTERYDSLTALQNDPDSLEMSDLRPMTVPEGPPTAALQSGGAIPHPVRRVEEETPLVIGFEVYHLDADAEGRTRYTVSYEVVRQAEQGGGFLGLFGGDEREQTATSTTYRGDSRAEEEYILLDSEDLSRGTEGEVRVTVRVTDETTGQTVDRSISFGPAPSANDEESGQG